VSDDALVDALGDALGDAVGAAVGADALRSSTAQKSLSTGANPLVSSVV
jgi:hypothetical protein